MAGNQVKDTLGSDHSDYATLGKQLYARYKILAKEYAVLGEKDFAGKAEREIKEWTDKFVEDHTTIRGFEFDKIGESGIAPLTGDQNKEIEKLRNIMGSLQHLALDTPLESINGEKRSAFGSREDIANWSKNFGLSGWSYHPTLTWVASQYNDENGHKLHPLTVLNQLRKTVGLPELGKTDQEILFNRLSAEAKAAVVNNPQNSTAINARAMWEIVDPNPDIKGDEYITPLVPNSKEIDTAAEANGIPRNELAMADYAARLRLDIEQVKIPGTWEYNQYNLYGIAVSSSPESKQNFLRKLRRPGL